MVNKINIRVLNHIRPYARIVLSKNDFCEVLRDPYGFWNDTVLITNPLKIPPATSTGYNSVLMPQPATSSTSIKLRKKKVEGHII